ncbi:MAG TPA: hypothetical protein PLZ42_03505 [Methanothrix sp.]|nr:hypothetical protein [Methanothrix sp.]
MARKKCFWYGELSAIVEPIAVVVGAGAVILAESLLPRALGFAGGDDLRGGGGADPRVSARRNASLATAVAMMGFAVGLCGDDGPGCGGWAAKPEI